MKIVRFLLLFICSQSVVALAKPSILIVDGRNNHDWRTTTEALRATLESTGLFDVSVSTAPEDKAPPAPPKPKVEDAAYLEAKQKRDGIVKLLRPAMDTEWAKWSVDFSRYQAVVLNYEPRDLSRADAREGADDDVGQEARRADRDDLTQFIGCENFRRSVRAAERHGPLGSRAPVLRQVALFPRPAEHRHNDATQIVSGRVIAGFRAQVSVDLRCHDVG